MKIIFILSVLVCQVLSVAASRFEYGKNVVIRQAVREDLYVGGENVTVNAPVYGDLVVAGGTVIINDTVTNDILLLGGTIVFNGYVGDDIRCTGGNIRIRKDIAGDVLIAGGELVVESGVTIGSLTIGGGRVIINGNINGAVKGILGQLYLNGSIAKGIDYRGETLSINGAVGGASTLRAQHIILGERAVFGNNVRYWSERELHEFKRHMKNGKAIYDPSLRMERAKWYFLGMTSVLVLLWYLGMALLMILIIQFLFARTVKNAAYTLFDQSLKSIGFGCLFLIGIPVVAIITFLTLIAIPVSLLLIFAYLSLLLFATVINSVVIANWLNNRFAKKWNTWRLGFAALGVFITLKLISSTPVVGGMMMILMTCASFGAILMSVPWKKRSMTTSNHTAL